MKYIFLLFLLFLNFLVYCQNDNNLPSIVRNGCVNEENILNQNIDSEEFISRMISSLKDTKLVYSKEINIENIKIWLKEEAQAFNLSKICNIHYLNYMTYGYPKEKADIEFYQSIQKVNALVTAEVYFLIADLFLSNDYLILQQEGQRYCQSLDLNSSKDIYSLCKIDVEIDQE